MAEKAAPEDKERCVTDGVDVLRRLPGQSMKGWNNMHIIDYFKDNDLKLLTSDKEGGFVVVTRDMFAQRSQQAILKNFKKEWRNHSRQTLASDMKLELLQGSSRTLKGH
ncbi:hypothetical protein HPB47_013431 [Ixodes persulcatus]|uniref:Uncharacterized protein n=1 Tax=Ixodes persulcatus TaxID=34615 RepID=A0AC60R1E2_IXOPE|nr:hypothetical protein HPB47_013431 [Ixodes persulcatus]